MEDIQLQVKELQSKIIQNTHLREKAIQLRPLLTDKNAQLQCDTQIKESKKYIDYFTEELNKLTYKITRASQLSLSPSSPITTTTTLPSPSDNIINNNNHDIIRPLSTLELTAQLPFYQHNNLSYQRFSTSSDFLSSPSPITPSSPSSNPFYFSYNHLLSTMEKNSLAYNNTNIDDNKNNSLASPVSPLVVAPFSANGINSKKKYTNLDLLKSDTPINRSKVSLKLHELEYKINIEKKVQKGIKNLSKTFNQSSPPGSEKRLKSEIKEKQAESKEKMALLTSAMKKYKDLYIGEESMDDLDEMDSLDEEEEEEENEQDDKNVNGVNRENHSNNRAHHGTRRPVTGKLQLKILEAKDLAHAPTRMFRVRQTAVMVKIDGTIQCHTKTSKNDKWVESFEMHVDKATEVELVIYDQSGDKTLPIGLFWLKISDITECLRKQKVDHDHQDENWVSADEAQLQHNQQHHTSSSSPSSSTSTTNSTNEIHLSSTTTNSKNNSTHNQQSTKNKSILSNGILAWFDVEPVGRIYLHVNFVREAGNRRPMDKLGRAGAVRERKGEIHESNGHQFITRRFYHIMKCALCNDFMTNFAYQCEGCSMACHRKCFDKVVTKCVSTELPSKEDDPEALRHRIPHRFEPLTIIGANWCCHCGSMLSLGFRGAHKCSECNIICHKKCTRFVPDFCGMTIEIASLMINEMRAANNRRSQFMDLSKLPANQLSHEHQQQNLYHNTNHSTPTHGNTSLSTSTTPSIMNNHHQHLNNRPFSIAFEPASYHSIPSLLGPSDSLHANKRSSQPLVPRKTTPLQLSKSGFGLDDFNLLAVLGKGNFGKVMLAEEKYTNNLYAIKILKKRFVLDNNEVESTRSEKRVFQIANQDRHPFLANLHSTFQTETRIYYVMEYISGGDLMMHIQHEQFSEKRARFYACEVLLALEYLHKHGIIYRDLKLDNIMLCLDGHVKLVDYGLCKENIWHNDTTNTFCGTPDFMAPEILLEQKYGRAVDWWAFGVLIYEMLLGQSPFKGEDEDEIFDAVLEDEILYPITMSKNCLSICQKLLERNPNRRLGSGKSDGLEVRQHPFFSGVNWDDILAKKVTPPYLPTVTGRADTSNFDEEFTREIPILTPVNAMLTKVEQQEFNQFSYIADWAIDPA